MLERRTYLGLLLKSVKHDEISAGACGVAVFPVKLFAFSASALIAGLCGVLLAANLKFLTPDLFGTPESFRYLMMAVVGGIGSATGGMVAALFLTLVPELLRSLGETNVRLLVYGTMVLFVLWFLPSGIGGLIDRVAPRGGAMRCDDIGCDAATDRSASGPRLSRASPRSTQSTAEPPRRAGTRSDSRDRTMRRLTW